MAKDAKKEPIDPAAVAEASAQKSVPGAEFSFAANVVKLNRAKEYVRRTNPSLKGNDFVDAVKERYVEIKGLLNGQEAVRREKGGTVVNVADDDGSKD